jgi:hypothetical protein
MGFCSLHEILQRRVQALNRCESITLAGLSFHPPSIRCNLSPSFSPLPLLIHFSLFDRVFRRGGRYLHFFSRWKQSRRPKRWRRMRMICSVFSYSPPIAPACLFSTMRHRPIQRPLALLLTYPHLSSIRFATPQSSKRACVIGFFIRRVCGLATFLLGTRREAALSLWTDGTRR